MNWLDFIWVCEIVPELKYGRGGYIPCVCVCEREREKEKNEKVCPTYGPKRKQKRLSNREGKGPHFAQEGGRWVKPIGFHVYLTF